MMPTNQTLRIHEACRFVRCHRSRNAPMTLLTIVTSKASNNQPMPRAAVMAVCTRFHRAVSSLRNSAVIVVCVSYERNSTPVLLPSSGQPAAARAPFEPNNSLMTIFRILGPNPREVSQRGCLSCPARKSARNSCDRCKGRRPPVPAEGTAHRVW